MVYIEVTFTLTPWNETAQDVLTALAGDIGFESFVEEGSTLKAYIQKKLYDEEAIQNIISDFPISDKIPIFVSKPNSVQRYEIF